MKRFGLGLLFFLLFASPVFATPIISITSVPGTLTIGQSFTLNASASALVANGVYYYKVRLGSDLSSLNKGQTFNSHNDAPDDWLSDGDAWGKFPQITIDAQGNWIGSVIGRPSDSASTGQNFITLRLRKIDGNTNYDSSENTVNVNPAPTSTPTNTPIPTNTPTPTNTPSPSPTNVPTNTPTNSPAPTKTPTPTKAPTPTKTPTVTEAPTPEATSEGAVLSVSNSHSPTPEATPSGSLQPAIISFALIGVGLGLLAIILVWQKRDLFMRPKGPK